jgi:hypothetical protein
MLRALLILTSLLAAVRADASRYTLGQLLERVQSESPSVVAARAAVAMRKAQLLEIQLHWTPEGETWLRAGSAPNVHCIDNLPGDCATTNVVDLVRGAPGSTWEDRAPFAGPNLFWLLQLRQPIFTSLKIESAIKASRGGIGTTEADLHQAELDLGVQVVRLYTQIKTERIALATVETSIGVLKNWSNYVEREINGANRPKFTESDGIRTRLMINGMGGQLTDHQRNLRVALAALRVLTNDPQADLDEEDLNWEDRDVGDKQVWRDRMLESKPEVQYGRAGMRYYKYWHRLQLAWALPDIALVTTLAWGFSPTFNAPNLGYVNQPFGSLGGGLGFGIRQPLDLAQKLTHWLQIRHEWESQQNRFQLGLAWWTVEIDKAWLDYQEARRRLVENERGLHVTQGWYALVDETLAMGLAPDGRDFIEVILNWSGFRQGTARAMSDAMVNLAMLRRMSGQPILDGGKL